MAKAGATGTGRILDLYCKAGGASMGFHMAGFEVYGVDIEPQPNYPFQFKKADALSLDPRWIRKYFVAVVGSPPCLGYTSLAARYPYINHEKLIPATRDLMEATELPYIIENVENAKNEMINPVRLCGSTFGLRVRRHRLFETGGKFKIASTPPCNHRWQNRHRPYKLNLSKERKSRRAAYTGIVPVHGTGQQLSNVDVDFVGGVAMGIDWMTRLELNQAIPPIYTYWLGRRLRKYLNGIR